jgi:hypothetical protein
MIMKIRLTLNGKRVIRTFSFTTEHHCSHYGQPVIVDNSGDVWDMTTLVINQFEIVDATPDEMQAFERIQKMYK